MKYRDKVYGQIEIKEQVLIELIKSRPILRLKKIAQYGVPDKYYHLKNFSRYEHSLGVMILLKKLGATIEEQVAGLIHDVSHSAFSHTIDWVLGDGRKGNEDMQDNLMDKFIKKGETGKILKKFNFCLERILNKNNFPLLERDIPDLCADRVDYTLREFKHQGNSGLIGLCLKSLINFNGEIVFNKKETAYLFAINFLKAQTEHFGGYEAMARWYLLSEVLKIALENKTICQEDIYFGDDFLVMKKLEKSSNLKIKEILSLMRHKKIKIINKKSGEKINKKFRYVDPKILIKSRLIRLSEIEPRFVKILDKHRKVNQKGLIV